MTYRQFLEASLNLKEFFKEQDILDNVIKVISPTSTGVVEFGNKFVDDYIKVVEIALGDDANWFSWFVFENDFGARGFEVFVKNTSYIISDEKTFYNVCIKTYNK